MTIMESFDCYHFMNIDLAIGYICQQFPVSLDKINKHT